MQSDNKNGKQMTEQEILKLTIEKKAYEEVIKQFTKGCIDARMECSLDEFLRGLENKIKEIDKKLMV
jgi:flagellar biosynthesis chaperone FliJ